MDDFRGLTMRAKLATAPLLETIVTSIDSHGQVHAAALGPRVSDDFAWLLLRPYEGSQTLSNLLACPEGVMHITDDVLMLVQAALDTGSHKTPPTVPLAGHGCPRLSDCCRWFAFEIFSSDCSQPRAELVARVVASGRERDFIGWHRARHAVIEAAILASRLHLLGRDQIEPQLEALRVIVDKTAGETERQAMALVDDYVRARLGQA